MQNSTNMRILELLQFLHERTDENHPATVSDIIAHLNGKGIKAVRHTDYVDTNAKPKEQLAYNKNNHYYNRDHPDMKEVTAWQRVELVFR